MRLTLQIDAAMREEAPANWRGDEVKERQVQNVLFKVMALDRKATQALFELVMNMDGY